MAQRTLFQLAGSSPLSIVSIIGSAGRRGDAHKMTKELYWKMVAKSEQVISDVFKLDLQRVHLVSGGAAWADHIAVTLFMESKTAALTLHMPAPWEDIDGGGTFVDNGRPSQSNPGKIANKLHKAFSDKIGEDTLKQIGSLRYLGAKLEVHDGFKRRNDKVAASKYLVAFSWSDNEEAPTKGGTLDTWNKCMGRKVHIPLSSLETWHPVKATQVPCSSSEVSDSLSVTTHPEQQLSTPETQQTRVSEELPTSNSPAKIEQGEGSWLTKVGGGSVDSGIGSLESLDGGSSHFLHKDIQVQSKRKRHLSDDISDDSDSEHDGVKKSKKRCINTYQSVSKKPKLSEFAKQALS